MFNKSFIKQFVPCKQPGLAYHIRRLPFEDPHTPVCLADNVKAVQMIWGFKVSLKPGEVCIENLDLVHALADGSAVPKEIAEKDSDKANELEQFNAMGALWTTCSRQLPPIARFAEAA